MKEPSAVTPALSAAAPSQGIVDRRRAIKWMLTAAASAAILPRLARAGGYGPIPMPKGYGPSPDVQRIYKPGELWPLTFTSAQRRAATALCDTIIPADAESPSASQVGVVDFLDEWISAPYAPDGGEYSFQDDRALFLDGLAWLDGESVERFRKPFADLPNEQRSAICDDICNLARARPEFLQPAKFFARFRELTAGGFYTTPEGTKDLKYVGNVAMATFDGPPLEVLKKVGLA
jgi:hypothetical protein